VAERIVGSEKIPARSAGLHHRGAGAFRQRIGIVGVVNAVRGAGVTRQARSAGPVDDRDPVLVLCQLGHAQGDRGVDQVRDHVDVFDIEPFARDPESDVRLVLVIGDDEFDRLAKNLAAKVFDRHSHGGDRTFTRFM